MIEFFEFQSPPRVAYKAGLVDELGHEVERLARAPSSSPTRAWRKPGCSTAYMWPGLRHRGGWRFQRCAGQTLGRYRRSWRELCPRAGADLIVAVGGGSPIDTAKAMSILLTEGGNLHDYEGYNVDRPPAGAHGRHPDHPPAQVAK